MCRVSVASRQVLAGDAKPKWQFIGECATPDVPPLLGLLKQGSKTIITLFIYRHVVIDMKQDESKLNTSLNI